MSDYSRDLRPAKWGSGLSLHSSNPGPRLSALGQKRPFLLRGLRAAKALNVRLGCFLMWINDADCDAVLGSYAASAMARLFSFLHHLRPPNGCPFSFLANLFRCNSGALIAVTREREHTTLRQPSLEIWTAFDPRGRSPHA